MRNNNINRHLQDQAQQILLEKGRLTQGLRNVNNAQDVFDLLGETALKSYVLPVQSNSKAGIVRGATQAEVDQGTLDNVYVQPKTLKQVVTKPEATDSTKGIARFATTQEVVEVQRTKEIVNPKVLHHALDVRKATESRQGTITTQTKVQAESGSDNTQAMTPLRVKEAIAKFTPKVEFQTATETTNGYTRLANPQQTAEGRLDTGYAISPKGFVNTRATTAQVGTTKLATPQQTAERQLNDVAVTPQGLAQLNATDSKQGFVKIRDDLNGDRSQALSANASVVPNNRRVNGHQLDRDINLNSGDVGTYSRQEIDDRIRQAQEQGVPQGTIVSFVGRQAPNGWMLCHGQTLNRHHHSRLFGVIGTTFGGQGDDFRLPDLRGEFIRGADEGRGVDRHRQFGSWQKSTMQVANGADNAGTAHGMAIGPNLQGQGHYEWEREGERCRNYIYHCRNHPPRWVGPANVSGNMQGYDAANLFGGDVVDDNQVRGIWHQWSAQYGNGDAVGTTPSDRAVGNGHLIFGTRPRNIALNYIIKL